MFCNDRQDTYCILRTVRKAARIHYISCNTTTTTTISTKVSSITRFHDARPQAGATVKYIIWTHKTCRCLILSRKRWRDAGLRHLRRILHRRLCSWRWRFQPVERSLLGSLVDSLSASGLIRLPLPASPFSVELEEPRNAPIGATRICFGSGCRRCAVLAA